MSTYYNEFDPQMAAWLRELISQGLLPDGDVDERSIWDVAPDDLREYTQCHFFAGIGGWPAAIKWLVGMPDDWPVWTGSCPCQPFSQAGAGAGFTDERHAWPAFFHLISQCRPARVYGEQVTNRLDWLDLVSTDMEAEGYAIGTHDLCAASVSAPHIRQRLYFAAFDTGAAPTRVADTDDARSQGRSIRGNGTDQRTAGENSMADGVADTDSSEPELFKRKGSEPRDSESAGSYSEFDGRGKLAQGFIGTSPCDGFWRDTDWCLGTDGRWRPTLSGAFPMANGFPERVGLLRGYGNAIVPQVAAEVIKAAEGSGIV